MMFGNNKPFGTATTFGTNTFGTTSTPFGQTTSAFGAKPSTNVFGTPAFGSTAPATGGLFGTAMPSTGTGLFGTPSTGFGQPTSSTSTGFGFGTTATSSGLFGTTTQPTTGTGLFGSSSTSAFGTPRPPFGGFSTTGGTGLFGQQQPQQSTGLFGQSSSTGTSLFGSSGFATTTSGTTIKFNPPTGTDTMMKNGVSTNINTRHQCITCMKEYENKSLEELRMEDYVANRKGQQTSTLTGFGSTPQTGLFGTPASTTSFTFGTNQSKPLFGGQTTSTFGTTSTGLFGQTQQQPTTGLFGKPAVFGTTTTPAGSTFSFGNTAGTSLFGSNTQQKPLFGQPTSTGLFGSTATTQPSTAFGTGSTFGTGFGTTSQTTGLFGTKPTGFGTPITSTSTFGTGTNTSTGLFGAKPTGSAFGTTTGTPGFSFAQPTSMGLFGQTKPATSFGLGTSTGFGTGLGTSFGTGTLGNTLGTSTGTSVFGSTTASKQPGFLFGATPNTGFSFGQTGTSAAPFSFGITSAPGIGSDPNAVALAHQQAQNQQFLALAMNPFGSSPLFRNMIKDTNKREDVLKPTNPIAQKAVLSSNQYKVSPKLSNKVKPMPIQLAANGKTALFDGLEDEEPNLSHDTFVPRRSVKKLVLKPKVSPESSEGSVRLLSYKPDMNRSDPPLDGHLGNLSSPTSVKKTSPLTVDIPERTFLHDSSSTLSKQRHLKLQASESNSLERYYTNPVTKPVPEVPASSDLDDTITALQIHSKPLRLGVPTSPGPKEKSDLERSSSKNEGLDSTPNLTEDDEHSHREAVIHPAGITLSRPGYYTIPPLERLEVDENGQCIVENFTIGREGYGNVYFPGMTDVTGLNLDEIVHLRRKEIIVYPDDENKPPVGEGLNKKAQVTLDCVWPNCKTTHTPIKNAERLAAMGYQEKIERATARLGAKFVEYRPETGSWVFQVQHFSKYGLEDSDEECEVVASAQGVKMQTDRPAPEHATTILKTQLTKPKQVNGTMEVIHPQQLLISRDEDDEMEDINQQTFTEEIEEAMAHLDEKENILSPSIHLKTLGVSGERLQGMRTTLFANDEGLDDNGDQWIAPCERFEKLSSTSLHPAFNTAVTEYTNQYPSKKIASLDKITANRSQFKSFSNSQSPQLPIITGTPLPSPTTDMLLRHTLLPSGMLAKPEAVKPRQAYGLPQRIGLIPYKQSMLNNKYKVLADMACFMGRSFRVGWGPKWTLGHLGKSLNHVQMNTSPVKPFGILSPRQPLDAEPSLLHISLEQVRMSRMHTSSDHVMQRLAESLDVQLSHCVSAEESGCPIFYAKPGVEALHAHASLMQRHAGIAGPNDADCIYLQQARQVWNLGVALWGTLPGTDPERDGPATYSYCMARKEALSHWLKTTTADIIQREIAENKVDKKSCLDTIFSHLTGHQINEACTVAREYRNLRLALLLAQAGGNLFSRDMIRKQLLIWKQSKADQFIDKKSLKIYSLLAGELVWPYGSDDIACCEGLDWRRSLALHLWYQCSMTSGIKDAVTDYEKSFQGIDSHGQHAPAPYPPYIEDDSDLLLTLAANESERKDSETSGVSYDMCFHLLKLYCDKTHPLDRLLAPTTATPSHLDHRLSWLVYQLLASLGYDHLPEYSANLLHCNFASQLESLGLWHWAAFVLLHITSAVSRRTLVIELLLRHVSLSQVPIEDEREAFLSEKLKVPKEWIFHAKAIKARSMGKVQEEAWYLLKTGDWNQSHKLVMKSIASDAIINENYDYLENFLQEMAQQPHCSGILDWNVGGQVFLDYIYISRVLESVLKGEINAYDLEQLQPRVVSLASRLNSLKWLTAKDRLCQAEMAKKMATLLRTVLMLQKSKHVGSRASAGSSVHELSPYSTKLPMPEDYAVQELRILVQSYLLEVTEK